MTEPGDAHDHSHGEGGSTVPAWNASGRIAVWLPLTLVILSLAGLMLAPRALRQHTKSMRADIRSVAEPTRLLLGDLRLGLAQEQTLAQRMAVAPESSVFLRYRRTVARDDSVLGRLRDTLRSLGTQARASVDSLHGSVSRWRDVVQVYRNRTPADLIRSSIARGVTYENLLAATSQVDTAVTIAMQSRRIQVEDIEQLELELTVVFGAVGCLASLAVLVLTLRGRDLRRLLRRRAEEESTLRRLAGALSGALTVGEVAELTVTAALQSNRVGGAYLTAAVDDHLVVVASRGTCVISPGARLEQPHWLKEGEARDDPHIFTTEVRSRGIRLRVHSGYDARSQLVVPMLHDGTVMGTLVLASAGGRRTFGDSAVRLGRALGDLAAVAVHRASALEREQHARGEAEAAVRTRDAVVSMVSHDLRNPLTAIMGGADFLLESMKEKPGVDMERTQLSRVKHAATSMNRLIANLLDITRMESGPLRLDRERMYIGEVIDDALELVESTVRTRRIRLEHVVAKDLPPIWGDRDRLAQALSNLLGNAVKFTPDGGRIRVTVEGNGAMVTTSVTDSGSGIPPDKLPHIFDRFWQATNGDRRGLGLGLSIVKGIIEAHGGEVRVRSAPNEGTTIGFVLPYANSEAQAGDGAAGVQPAARDTDEDVAAAAGEQERASPRMSH
jgi:signal transduction histidine kinase